MADLQVLKQLKERIDKIAEERNNLKLQEQADKVAMEQAMQFQMHTELVGAVKQNTQRNEEMLNAIAGMKIEVPKIDTPIIPPIIIPEIKVPDIHIPEIKVPTINIPKIEIPKIELPTINVPEPRVTVNVEKQDPPIIPPFPEIKMPDYMTVQGEVSLAGINPLNPLPVTMVGNFPVSGGGSKMGSSKTLDGAGNKITSTSGALDVNISGGNVTLQASDIEIGAVELKNGTDDTRATVTAANALKVDGSAVTQPVSGTFFQATQPVSVASTLEVIQVSGSNWSTSASQVGTWTVQPGNTANTTAWFVTRNFKTRSDTYTAAASGTTVDISTDPLESFSIQVKGTGASATTWDVRLEGSLDGTNFTQILQHTNTTGDGAVLFSGAIDSPCLYFRSRCAAVVLGGATNIVVTILGNT